MAECNSERKRAQVTLTIKSWMTEEESKKHQALRFPRFRPRSASKPAALARLARRGVVGDKGRCRVDSLQSTPQHGTHTVTGRAGIDLSMYGYTSYVAHSPGTLITTAEVSVLSGVPRTLVGGALPRFPYRTEEGL
ncbi:hypothetical protein J6590_039241 [Homalodisca vitripennis]|nr:hypothetical protein J6590_039241 [Homalodisca vitripennis]